MSKVLRMPDGSSIRRTTYGEVMVTPGGFASIVANEHETYMWAHKAGNVWPCSELSGHGVEIAIAENGDLADYEGPENVGADELSAYISDCLSFVVDSHPGMRR
jgi:hypothetical protein